MTKKEARDRIRTMRVKEYQYHLTHVEQYDVAEAKSRLTDREIAEALDEAEAEINTRFRKPHEAENERQLREWQNRPWWKQIFTPDW